MTTEVAGNTSDVSITVSDTGGYRKDTFKVSRAKKVAELVEDLARIMELDHANYRPRVERLGTLLTGEETVGDVLQDQDELVLHPEINAACEKTVGHAGV